MAVVNLNDGDTIWATATVDNIPVFAVRHVGTGALGFTEIVLNIQGVSYYYWPNTSGALRYGTTEPTISTQDSAGSAV